VLATSAALLLGCGGPTTEQVQTLEERVEELEAAARPTEATEELEARLTELEDGLDQLTSTLEPAALIERADATDAELARLVDALSVLEEELAILGEELAGSSRAVDRHERPACRGRRGPQRPGRGAADNDELRALIVTVRDRLDRCQADGSC
jgi:hypothetical protein